MASRRVMKVRVDNFRVRAVAPGPAGDCWECHDRSDHFIGIGGLASKSSLCVKGGRQYFNLVLWKPPIQVLSSVFGPSG